MSNVFTGNPWILDTTGVVSVSNPVKIHTLRWVGGANTNACTATDGAAAATIWNVVATADNFTAQTTWPSDRPYVSKGFAVTITGGKLYVYYQGQIPFTV